MKQKYGILCLLAPVFLSAGEASSQAEKQNMDLSPADRSLQRTTNGVHVSADFIYWKAKQGNIAYAESGLGTDRSTSNVTQKGHVYYPDFHYKPGFKVALGWMSPNNDWNLTAQYTWYQSEHNKGSTHTGNFLKALWEYGTYSSVQNILLTGAEANWKLHFNVLDLQWAKSFAIGKHVTLNPHFGLKGTWQRQKLFIDYDFIFDPNIAFTQMKESKQNFNQFFGGVGLSAGMDASWYFCNDWSLIGSCTLSAVYGWFNGKMKEHLDLYDGTSTVIANTGKHTTNIMPVLEMFLGIQWERWFGAQAYHLAVQAGWEEQVWWDQNQFIRRFQESPLGSLTLEGLTLSAQFGF